MRALAQSVHSSFDAQLLICALRQVPVLAATSAPLRQTCTGVPIRWSFAAISGGRAFCLVSASQGPSGWSRAIIARDTSGGAHRRLKTFRVLTSLRPQPAPTLPQSADLKHAGATNGQQPMIASPRKALQIPLQSWWEGTPRERSSASTCAIQPGRDLSISI